MASRLIMYWTVLTAGRSFSSARWRSARTFRAAAVGAAGESFQVKAPARRVAVSHPVVRVDRMYVLIPNCRVRVRHALIGALVAAIASEAASAVSRPMSARATTRSMARSQSFRSSSSGFTCRDHRPGRRLLASTLAAFDYRPDAPTLRQATSSRPRARACAFAQAQREGKG